MIHPEQPPSFPRPLNNPPPHLNNVSCYTHAPSAFYLTAGGSRREEDLAGRLTNSYRAVSTATSAKTVVQLSATTSYWEVDGELLSMHRIPMIENVVWYMHVVLRLLVVAVDSIKQL